MDIRFFKAWGIFVLVVMLGSIGSIIALSVVLGIVLGIVFASQGRDPSEIEPISYNCGLALGIVVPSVISFFTYRWSIRKFVFTQLPQAIPATYYPPPSATYSPYDQG